MSKKFETKTPFIDLLFIMLLGFVSLFVLSFIQINPIAKKEDIESIDDFMIVLEWDDKDESDYDLWLRTPNNEVIGFVNKNGVVAYLDRDDLGKANDTITLANGNQLVLENNREVIFIRNAIEGKYFINIHAYYKRDELSDSLRVKVIDVKSGLVVFYKKIERIEKNEEKIVGSFYVNEKKRIIDTNDEGFQFVTHSGSLHRLQQPEVSE
jgi:hypothetical protein